MIGASLDDEEDVAAEEVDIVDAIDMSEVDEREVAGLLRLASMKSSRISISS
jgi:hypothetical protein